VSLATSSSRCHFSAANDATERFDHPATQLFVLGLAVSSPSAALFALNVEPVEFADQVSKNDGAFSRHSASQSPHDSGAAAM
jgi:hypothetical protein